MTEKSFGPGLAAKGSGIPACDFWTDGKNSNEL